MAKAQRKRRTSVCVLSHHPLVLEDFRGLLPANSFRVQGQPLDPAQTSNLRRMPVPQAAVYVLDAPASRPATEMLVSSLRERFPEAAVLVMAESFSKASAFPLLQLGVRALLIYGEARAQLCRAVEAVSAGRYWVPRELLAGFVESVLKNERGRQKTRSSARLSRREQEVLDALLLNLSNKEIAARLNISERTAKFHVSNLLAKFGVRRRADLILVNYHAAPAN